MLQRVQTLYLLATFVLSFLMFFLPIANFQVGGAEYLYTVTGLGHENIAGAQGFVRDSWSVALIILQVLILIVNVIGIFLYKNRIFQIRFNLFNILLYVGFYPLFFLYAWASSEHVAMDLSTSVELHYCIPMAFPIVNGLLTYLAVRAIGRDEALVRSLDRIR